MSYPLQPGEPGYHDSQYAVDQARQMERDAAWIAYDRFHEATDSEIISSQQARIRALEGCLRDHLRDFPCEHAEYDRCCSSCEAKRLLALSIHIAR